MFCPFPLPLKLPDFFLWPLTMTATPQLMLNRKWYQLSKPEIEFLMINMMYAALPMCAQTEKTTFSCKDDWGKCILEWGQGTCKISRPYPAQAYSLVVLVLKSASFDSLGLWGVFLILIYLVPSAQGGCSIDFKLRMFVFKIQERSKGFKSAPVTVYKLKKIP